MKSDAFLQLYRTYESLLRDIKGVDPKVEEDKQDDLTGNRLRMCRQFRNYLVHMEDPGFIEVSDKMGKFLNACVDGLKAQGDVVKKHIKKPASCMLSADSRVDEAILMFMNLKRDYIVVDMGEGKYAKLPVFNVLGTTHKVKVGLLKMSSCKPVFCAPLDDYAKLDRDKVTLCTDDGTPGGKLLGQVIF